MDAENIIFLEKLHEEPQHTIWTVKIPEDGPNINPLHTGSAPSQPGLYTLVVSSRHEQPPHREVLKWCDVPPLPGVATLLAVTRGVMREDQQPATYYWYEPLEAGTLKALVEARGGLSLAEVATLAHHLGVGLQSLVAAQIPLPSLQPQHVMITVAGLPEIVCPLWDIGSLAPKIEMDECALAQELVKLLWLALTGEYPQEAYRRVPLPLAADVPETLGLALEKLLDREDSTLQKVLDAFADFDSQPLNAYASASSSVRAKMPLAHQNEQKTKGAKTLSQTRRANARKLAGRSSLGKGTKNPLTSRRVILAGVGTLLILGAGAVAGAAWLPGMVQVQHQESQSAQPMASSTPVEEQIILMQVLDERNASLSSQGIATLKVRALTQVEHPDAESLKITAEVEAPGYTPTQAEQENSGVHLVDGTPVQTVTFELHRQEDHWKLDKATPVVEEQPGE